MRTLIVDPDLPEVALIAEAARVLAAEGLVAFPTETVYGLGGLATSPRAVAKIFDAKGRPRSHPLIAHVLDEAQARALTSGWPSRAARLAAAFWPGPLTLVAARASQVPADVAGGGDSIAVRAPSHPVARALIEALGAPIAAPSANRYQALSPTRASHVARGLAGRIDLLVDGGPTTAGIESTVVDVRGARPVLLRPGAVAIAELRRIVPDLETARETDAPARDEPRPSPGMDPRHYAPRAAVHLVEGAEAALDHARARSRKGAKVALVLRGGAEPSCGEGLAFVRALPDDPAGYARELFAALHGADEAGGGVDALIVQAPPADEPWSAVADRLARAATPAR